jgi:integrin alpha FG-GAP repeat containing protein 1
MNRFPVSENFLYRKGAEFRHPSRVQNAVPGDFTQDGRLDLLVMADGGLNQIGMSLYVAHIDGGLGMFALPVRGDRL